MSFKPRAADICLLPDNEESSGDAFEGNYWTVIDGVLEIHHGEGETDYVLIIYSWHGGCLVKNTRFLIIHLSTA